MLILDGDWRWRVGGGEMASWVEGGAWRWEGSLEGGVVVGLRNRMGLRRRGSSTYLQEHVPVDC